jgi:Protein of unknown function (DUF2959)
MKISRFSLLTASVAVLLTSGCSTTGYESAQKSTLKMDQTRQELIDAKYQITATFAALDQLLNVRTGNLVPLQKDFSKEVRKFQQLAAETRPKALAMQEQSAAYFNEWAGKINQIQDPQIRAKNAARREIAMKRYAAIEKDASAVRASYWPLYTLLNDINTSLETDLTASGIQSVRNACVPARSKAIELQSLVDKTIKSIDAAIGTLAPQA